MASMTVGELIEYLQDFDETDEVMFAYDYGDYWHNTVAANISQVEYGKVKWSEYHRMNKVDNNSEDDEYEDDSSKDVVLLLS